MLNNLSKDYNLHLFLKEHSLNNNTYSQRMNRNSKKYRQLHFAVMVIEASAKQEKMTSREMFQRLKAQDLIRQRLNRHYEMLHTQSLDWVVEDTIETLHNWEAQKT